METFIWIGYFRFWTYCSQWQITVVIQISLQLFSCCCCSSTRNSNWWHKFLISNLLDKMNVDLWWEISHSFVSSKFCFNSAAMNIWVLMYTYLLHIFRVIIMMVWSHHIILDAGFETEEIVAYFIYVHKLKPWYNEQVRQILFVHYIE